MFLVRGPRFESRCKQVDLVPLKGKLILGAVALAYSCPLSLVSWKSRLILGAVALAELCLAE